MSGHGRINLNNRMGHLKVKECYFQSLKAMVLDIESIDFLTSCGTFPRRSPPCTGTGWRASCTRRRSRISPCKYDPKKIGSISILFLTNILLASFFPGKRGR